MGAGLARCIGSRIVMTGLAQHIFKEKLPDVRGKITYDASLSKHSWFRTGGPADVLFEPADKQDLVHFLKALPLDVPVMVIGVGSNLLVRDGGIEGVVIRLGKNFATITHEGACITAGAAAMDVHVARAAQKIGLAGLEWLVGVPGTIGGAIRMNAGAYMGELSHCLQDAVAVDRSGQLHSIRAEDLGFEYRYCDAPNDWIFLSATLCGSLGANKQEIAERMQTIMAERQESQPIGTQTGGSTFKNPTGQKAWQLIDAAGCRGLKVGQAMMSEKHCNFMINCGGATAKDIETLGEDVRKRVKDHSGVSLEWEIRRVGREGIER